MWLERGVTLCNGRHARGTVTQAIFMRQKQSRYTADAVDEGGLGRHMIGSGVPGRGRSACCSRPPTNLIHDFGPEDSGTTRKARGHVRKITRPRQAAWTRDEKAEYYGKQQAWNLADKR